MGCKNCGEKNIANKFHKLCLRCNNKRLYGNEFGKQYQYVKKNKQSLRSDIKRLKQDIKKGVLVKRERSKSFLQVISKDEVFYEECFNLSDHKCEECGERLPDQFRNSLGKVIARFRYSHIIPKSIAPQLRHKVKNINHLCLKHHTQWDFGDKKSMKIYLKNRKLFPEFLE